MVAKEGRKVRRKESRGGNEVKEVRKVSKKGSKPRNGESRGEKKRMSE